MSQTIRVRDWRRLSKTYEKHWKTAKVLIGSNWMFGAPAVNVTVMATPAKLLDGITSFQKKDAAHPRAATILASPSEYRSARWGCNVPLLQKVRNLEASCFWSLWVYVGLCIWTCRTTPDRRFDSPFAPGIHRPGLDFASNSPWWIYSSIASQRSFRCVQKHDL